MWKDNIYRGFLIFFESLTFGVNSGVKQYKMAQNDKKLCLFYSIYHEAYIIWSWILVHMCEMMTSLFSRFWYLIFWTVRRGEVKGQKNGPKWQHNKKFCLSHSVSQELYLIWLWFLVHIFWTIISPAIFSLFSKFCVFMGFRG